MRGGEVARRFGSRVRRLLQRRTLTAVGEAKVRAGRRDVERAFERAQELQRRWPDKISGKLVPVLYALVAEPSAVQRARELKVWLIESKREAVSLEEVLGAGGPNA